VGLNDRASPSDQDGEGATVSAEAPIGGDSTLGRGRRLTSNRLIAAFIAVGETERGLYPSSSRTVNPFSAR